VDEAGGVAFWWITSDSERSQGILAAARTCRQWEGRQRMRFLGPAQQVLTEVRGPVQATLLAARVLVRYDELYAHRLRFGHRALRQHYEDSILAGLALYQILREENDDREAALATVDRILAAAAHSSVPGQWSEGI
jgi:hypothetical protein